MLLVCEGDKTVKIEIDLDLSTATWHYINQEAERRQLSVAAIVGEVLSEAIEDYYKEPTKAEILEGIKSSLQQALNDEAQTVEYYN